MIINRENLEGTISTEQKRVGKFIEAGNTGFRIVILNNSTIWNWHFTPENSDSPPALADMPLRIKYVRMFMLGFKYLINWILQEKTLENLTIPEELSSTTNKTQKDFLVKIFGEDKVLYDEVKDGKFYTRILLSPILNDKVLWQKLIDNEQFIIRYPITVYEYED